MVNKTIRHKLYETAAKMAADSGRILKAMEYESKATKLTRGNK